MATFYPFLSLHYTLHLFLSFSYFSNPYVKTIIFMSNVSGQTRHLVILHIPNSPYPYFHYSPSLLPPYPYFVPIMQIPHHPSNSPSSYLYHFPHAWKSFTWSPSSHYFSRFRTSSPIPLTLCLHPSTPPILHAHFLTFIPPIPSSPYHFLTLSHLPMFERMHGCNIEDVKES